MAAIRFAFGNRPSISGREAAAIADLLYLLHTLDANHLANRLKSQAELNSGRSQASEEIRLTPREMGILLTVVREEADRADSDAVSRLRDELQTALDRA